MGLINEIKNDIAKAGENRGKILYVKSGNKIRVRFLQEIDEGYSFLFHQNFNKGYQCLCPKNLDEDNECIYCDAVDGNSVEDGDRTYKMYAWSVYDFDAKEVKVALFKVNRCSPVSSLVDMSENYGTIMDRDYVLIKTGKGFDTSWSILPQDKSKFKNEKAKPLTKKAVLEILAKAYPYEGDLSKDEDIEKAEKEAKKKKYAALDDEELPWEDKKDKKKKKSKEKDADEDEGLSVDWMEEKLDDEDIDSDEFCEFHEVKSLKKLTSKSKKEFKKMIEEYLESLEDDDEEEDDE